MPSPPEQIPTGLTEHEYRRLHTLYSLMDRHEEALEAIKHASMLVQQEGTLEASESNQYQQGMELGQKFLSQLIDFAGKASEENDKAATEDKANKIIEEMQSQFETLGLTAEQSKDMASQMREVLLQAAAPSEPPSRDVPEGLSAEEYYRLGVRYKDFGWTEQSRDALSYAIEKSDEPWSSKARAFLRTRLPHNPVPLMAEQRNIHAFNLMVNNSTAEAYNEFFQLIQDYPDFEWPFGNLATLYIRDGKFKAAREALAMAFAINPYYINALYHFCRLLILEDDFAEARRLLVKIAEIDPEDDRLTEMHKTVDEVESWSKQAPEN